MDQRARKELGQVVPKESKIPANIESTDATSPPTTFDSGRGGKREGAGRPRKNTLEQTATKAMEFAIIV